MKVKSNKQNLFILNQIYEGKSYNKKQFFSF